MASVKQSVQTSCWNLKLGDRVREVRVHCGVSVVWLEDLTPHPGNACMSICHCHFQSENLTERREIDIAHDLSIYGVLHTKF